MALAAETLPSTSAETCVVTLAGYARASVSQLGDAGLDGGAAGLGLLAQRLRVGRGLLDVGHAGGDVLLHGGDALLHVGHGLTDGLDGQVGDADAGEDGLEGFGLEVALGGGHGVLLQWGMVLTVVLVVCG